MTGMQDNYFFSEILYIFIISCSNILKQIHNIISVYQSLYLCKYVFYIFWSDHDKRNAKRHLWINANGDECIARTGDARENRTADRLGEIDGAACCDPDVLLNSGNFLTTAIAI